MGGHVVDHHGAVDVPAGARALVASEDAEDHLGGRGLVRAAVDVARALDVEHAALEPVADRVVEHGHRADPAVRCLDLADIVLIGALRARERAAAAGPALAVDQRVRIDRVQGAFDRLHGLEIVQRHQVEAEAVDLVFLRPVADRIDHVLAEHRALRGRLVAAAAAVRGAAVVCEAVVIIGDDAVEIGIETEGVVVHHVHHHADPGLVQALHHLLELVHAHRAVIGIGGVAAFGDVVVLRIVAPVELRLVGALVHGGVVVDRLEMDVRDSEILQIIHADRDARAVGQPGLGEGEILARILRGGDRVGEVAHVHLPDHGVAVGAQRVDKAAVAEALRVGGGEVDDHASIAVHARRAGVGIHGLLRAESGRDGVGVIGPVAAGIYRRPHALVAALHRDLLKGLASVALLEQAQRDCARRRRPELEDGLAAANGRAEIVAVIDVLRDELFAVEDLRRHGGRAAEAFDLHAVDMGELEGLGGRDDAAALFFSERVQRGDRDLPVPVEDADLVERSDAHGGSHGIADLARRDDTGHFELMYAVQAQATVLAGILHFVAAPEIDLRALAREDGVAVGFEVLCRAAPGAPAGGGTLPPDDEADLLDLLRHVEHDLAAVGAGMEQLAVAVLAGIPDPDVAVLIAVRRALPVQRQLAAALLERERVFLLRGGNCLRSALLRGNGARRRGRGAVRASAKQRQQHQRREKQSGKPFFLHLYHLVIKNIRRGKRRMSVYGSFRAPAAFSARRGAC